jgi:hypothetical protein
MVNPEMYWAERREDNEPQPSWMARQRRCTYGKERLQSGCVLYQMAPSVARHPGGTGMTKDLTQNRPTPCRSMLVTPPQNEAVASLGHLNCFLAVIDGSPGKAAWGKQACLLGDGAQAKIRGKGRAGASALRPRSINANGDI